MDLRSGVENQPGGPLILLVRLKIDLTVHCSTLSLVGAARALSGNGPTSPSQAAGELIQVDGVAPRLIPGLSPS